MRSPGQSPKPLPPARFRPGWRLRRTGVPYTSPTAGRVRGRRLIRPPGQSPQPLPSARRRTGRRVLRIGVPEKIDPATGTVTKTIPVGSGPYGVAVTPDGSTVYVSHGGSGSGLVSVIDTVTGAVAKTI